MIDTNVLLVASAAHPFSPFSDSHVPPEHRERVLDWLVAFRDSLDRLLVLDRTMRILGGYLPRWPGWIGRTRSLRPPHSPLPARQQ